MRFLVTNDDGIDAPGLRVLEGAAARLGEVRVLAPRDAHSGCSHIVTTNRPLTVSECGLGRRCVDGSPADCTRIGLTCLHPDTDWVLSGVNAGGNLGADVYLSGTVAAVREAVLLGKPGIAVSQYRRKDAAFDWPRAVPWVTAVLRELLRRPVQPGMFFNVNLPHLDSPDESPAVVECPVDPGPLHVRYRYDGASYHYEGDYHGRRRAADCDVDVCFSGRVAVSQVKLL